MVRTVEPHRFTGFEWVVGTFGLTVLSGSSCWPVPSFTGPTVWSGPGITTLIKGILSWVDKIEGQLSGVDFFVSASMHVACARRDIYTSREQWTFIERRYLLWIWLIAISGNNIFLGSHIFSFGNQVHLSRLWWLASLWDLELFLGS